MKKRSGLRNSKKSADACGRLLRQSVGLQKQLRWLSAERQKRPNGNVGVLNLKSNAERRCLLGNSNVFIVCHRIHNRHLTTSFA